MSSPKKSDYIDFEKKIIRKDTRTILRIKESGRLFGSLRISNMLPVPKSEIVPYLIKNELDIKYKSIILNELRYFEKNSEKIIKNAKLVYSQKINNINTGYIKNTVDFKILEEKSNTYNDK